MDFFVPVHDIVDEEWERVFAVNVTGAMRLCRSVVPPHASRANEV